jgi:putative transcriptional regulator
MIEHGHVKTHQVRLFAGYSGWSANQLEEEIKNKHWLLNKPTDASFLADETDALWGNQLTEIKESYGVFANFGSDPGMN